MLYFKMLVPKILFLFLVILYGCAGSESQVVSKVPANKLDAHKPVIQGPKIKIAVIDFANKSDFGDERLGLAAADILTTELFKTGAFILVERGQITQIFNEQSLGMSGGIDPTTAVKAGKVLGTSALVVGSISQFEIKTEDQDYLLCKQKKMIAEVTVDVRVIDVTTGMIFHADSVKGVHTLKFLQVLDLGRKAVNDEVLGRHALRSAIVKFLDGLVAELAETKWSARIAGIENEKYFINAGKRSGLKVGDILMVEELGEPIKDPQSKIVIGWTPGKYRGKVKVVGFFGNDGSIAISISGSGFETNDMVTFITP